MLHNLKCIALVKCEHGFTLQ